MKQSTRPRIVPLPAIEPTLAQEIAAYLRGEQEQRERKARIMAAARANMRARGEWGVVDFDRILREHGGRG